MKPKSLRFIDLFAGIGGFHLALTRQGAKCAFVSEIDPDAQKTYLANHKVPSKIMHGDITKIDITSIPSHDILCAGFPCQPFSQAGFKKGFEDTRGTLFFDILRILEQKKPKAYFLENVRGLLKHDEGKTFSVIEKKLKGLGYSCQHFLVRASEYGLPQHRPRLFIIGFSDNTKKIIAPEKIPLRFTMSDVFEGKCDKDIGFTLRVGGRGSKINDRRNWEFYNVDNKVQRITSEKAKLLQGFPPDFVFPVSEITAMKQLGNSVAVDAIENFYKQIKGQICV
jgi:DNA (cytosine-5)-methyltransferase 1